MLRKTPLVEGETYHIFNRGAHKQEIFLRPVDYDRFMCLLHLSNTSKKIHLSDFWSKSRISSGNIYERRVDKALVDILAYTLMPNHFHLILLQKCEGGISLFMKKLATAYAMYFNVVHEHSGVVFQGRYQSLHIDTEPYHRWIFSYVHLNPVDLVESGWQEQGIVNVRRTRHFMKNYHYSSYLDFCGRERQEKVIVNLQAVPWYIRKNNDLEDMLKWERRGRKLYVKDRP